MIDFTVRDFHCVESQLKLDEAYASIASRNAFETRLEGFLSSDRSLYSVFERPAENILRVRGHLFLPPRLDNRTPLVCVFGNAAPHSVVRGVRFASERGGKLHRFWPALARAGFLTQKDLDMFCSYDHVGQRALLLSGRLSSVFRIGFVDYCPFPSSASDPRWSGVAGVRRLLGIGVLRAVLSAHETWLNLLVREFFGAEQGGVIAFQSGAYDSLRISGSRSFSMAAAKRGELITECKWHRNLLLVGVPTTRLLNSRASRSTLVQVRRYLVERLGGISAGVTRLD